MNRSLSVLLPVYNVQRSLSRSVLQVLDVLAELTSRFELVIVDGSSTDGTWDVAQELARSYPQVRLLREPDARGFNQSDYRILSAIHGDVVIAHDGETPIDAGQIVRLWRSLTPAAPQPKLIRSAVYGMQVDSHRSSLSDRRTQPSSAGWPVTESYGGFRQLRPAAIEELRRTVATAQNGAIKSGKQSGRTESQKQTSPTIDAADAQTRRPNFLSRVTTRVRDFARGE